MKLTQKTLGLSVFALAAALFATATLADRMPPPPEGMMMTQADANGDGKVSKEEFDAWRAAQVADLDADKDGKISQDELYAHRMKMAEPMAKDFAARMMARLDADKDGKLTAAELASDPVPGFEMMDHNGDGVIDQAEMQDMQDMHGGKGKGHHRHPKGDMMNGGDMQGNN